MNPSSANITLVIPAAPGIHIDALDSARRQTRAVAVLVEEGKHPSVNRNRGAARAATPFIAFTNAHTLLREDWAECAEAFFAAHPDVDVMGGPQLNYPKDSYFARLSGDALATSFCTGKMSRRYRAAEKDLDADEASLTSANLICRRKVFERVRFDENLYPGEDPKFITDARRAGFKVAYTPEVVVFNRRRTNLAALWKQIANYGSTRVQKETPAELLRHAPFFAPAALTAYLVLLPVLLCWSACWLLPLAAYAVLALFFAILTAMECRRAEYPVVLPPVFLWIHLAYGAGFLSRLLRGGWAKS